MDCYFSTYSTVIKLMKKGTWLLLGLLMSAFVSAQKSSWATLSLVSSTTSFDAAYGIEVKKVKVSPAVKAMQGTELEVDGYIIPLSGKLAQTTSCFPNSVKRCVFLRQSGTRNRHAGLPGREVKNPLYG